MIDDEYILSALADPLFKQSTGERIVDPWNCRDCYYSIGLAWPRMRFKLLAGSAVSWCHVLILTPAARTSDLYMTQGL